MIEMDRKAMVKDSDWLYQEIKVQTLREMG